MSILRNHHRRILRVRFALLVLIGATSVPSAPFAGSPPAGVGSDEWAGIQAQIEAERHKVVASDRPDRLYRADNPT